MQVVFPLKLDLGHSVSFTYSLYWVVAEGFDVSALSVSSVSSGEVLPLGTGVYSHSWICKPHIWLTCWTINPDYQCLGDSSDCVGGVLVLLPLNHLGYWPSWPLPFTKHLIFVWSDQLQLSHFIDDLFLVWKTTFTSLLIEVSPCLLLHSVLRHEMTIFGSITPPRVPITGSQDGVSMDNLMTPQIP